MLIAQFYGYRKLVFRLVSCEPHFHILSATWHGISRESQSLIHSTKEVHTF